MALSNLDLSSKSKTFSLTLFSYHGCESPRQIQVCVALKLYKGGEVSTVKNNIKL